MIHKIFYDAFLFVILAACISSSSLSNNSVENNNSSEKEPTLIQSLQGILQDPEYLALSNYEQLLVLEVIYSLLKTRFSQSESKRKYQGKSPFVF
jgi:hypothetical protein